MPLRRRVAFSAAGAVALAIVIAALVCYVVVRGQLRGQVHGALKAQAVAIQHGDFHDLGRPVPSIPASAGGPAQYVQVTGTGGALLRSRGDVQLPINSRTRAVASGTAGSYLSDAHVGGNHLREITFALPVLVNGQPEQVAIQLARPLNQTDHVLSHLRLILLLLCAGGIALAAALGRLAARRVLAPLAEVAQTAQHIGETEDLASRLRVHADDEVGQLATRFNAMLERLQGSRAALDESVRAQRQLVADASHELRTPITSLRTNVEVLLESGELSDEERHRLLADVVEQSEELTGLIGDLIELARGDLPVAPEEEVRLDRVAEESVARARRNSPHVTFATHLRPVIVDGVAERLGRAVNNLLDNAARHSPRGATVEVTVDADGIRVRDHGSGVEEADLPYVFDRFFRGAGSRGHQGSGLGLAIVRQVAAQHGGSVSVENASDGGAVFSMRLPTSTADAADTEVEQLPAPQEGGLASRF
jgi:two-component system sensor histidine kinase MprB